MKQKKFKGKAIKLALTLTIAMVFGAVGMLPGVMQTGHAKMGYNVYIDDGISNGVVSSDESYTSGSGETVTLTVTPGDGYKLKKLSVIQPDVLDSVSDLVDLMGGAEFAATNDGYSVKIDEGKFSIFHNGTKTEYLDNSATLNKDNASYGNYVAHSGYDWWYFDIEGGKLRNIAFRNDGDYGLDFTGTGANTISGTAIETTTVTEGTKYTFTAPRSNVYVTAEFEMLDPKTVLIDVGKDHESLFTADVLNQIKTGFELEDVTISGNVITLKGVHPSTTEHELWEDIEYFVHDLVRPADRIHNGEKYMNTGYKAIDEYATSSDLENDIYNDVHKTTPVSDNMTYYLLWAKPYEKLEIDNGNPTCGKESWSALPTAPGGFMVNPEDFTWRDENEEVVETFEGGKEYTFHGEVRRTYGELWKYFLDPDNFTLTVKDGKVVRCEVDGNYVYVAFKATADHDWDAGTVTKQPTATAEGVKTFKCKHCGATKTEKIPKLAPSKAKPAAPKVTTVAKTSARAMTVKWTMKWGKVNGAKSYKVAYRKVGSKKWTYKKTKKTKYVVKGHKMKGLYEYKVAAVSKKGSTWSNTSRRYFNGVKTTAKAGKGAIKVSWKKAKGASGYQVLVATNEKMKNAKKYVVSKSAKTYKVKGLKSGKKYYVKVRPLKTYKGETYKGILCKPKAVKVK